MQTHSFQDEQAPDIEELPDEWEVRRLGEGVNLISGQHIMAADWSEDPEGTPYLTGPSDFEDGSIEVTKYTTAPKSMCQPGDILITVKGSGTGQMVRSDGAYCISRQLMAIRSIDWDPDYLFAALRPLVGHYGEQSTGLIPGITRKDLNSTIIITPPRREQERIAATLQVWDRAIDHLNVLCGALERQQRGLTQRLLTGSLRLPAES